MNAPAIGTSTVWSAAPPASRIPRPRTSYVAKPYGCCVCQRAMTPEETWFCPNSPGVIGGYYHQQHAPAGSMPVTR